MQQIKIPLFSVHATVVVLALFFALQSSAWAESGFSEEQPKENVPLWKQKGFGVATDGSDDYVKDTRMPPGYSTVGPQPVPSYEYDGKWFKRHPEWIEQSPGLLECGDRFKQHSWDWRDCKLAVVEHAANKKESEPTPPEQEQTDIYTLEQDDPFASLAPDVAVEPEPQFDQSEEDPFAALAPDVADADVSMKEMMDHAYDDFRAERGELLWSGEDSLDTVGEQQNLQELGTRYSRLDAICNCAKDRSNCANVDTSGLTHQQAQLAGVNQRYYSQLLSQCRSMDDFAKVRSYSSLDEILHAMSQADASLGKLDAVNQEYRSVIARLRSQQREVDQRIAREEKEERQLAEARTQRRAQKRAERRAREEREESNRDMEMFGAILGGIAQGLNAAQGRNTYRAPSYPSYGGGGYGNGTGSSGSSAACLNSVNSIGVGASNGTCNDAKVALQQIARAKRACYNAPQAQMSMLNDQERYMRGKVNSLCSRRSIRIEASKTPWLDHVESGGTVDMNR